MFKLRKQQSPSMVIALTALAGAIIGSAVALLYAPKKGSGFSQIGRHGKNGAGILSFNKAAMHPVEINDPKGQGLSKAAAMVNHLKQNKQEGSQFPNPL